MLDYLKMWIYDTCTIENILANTHLQNKGFHSSDNGELMSITANFKSWQIETWKLYRLEITGSIRKYWNDGTNENDFYFTDAIAAIKKLCKDLSLNPALAYVKNLEFGVNLQLEINASEIIDQIICFNYVQPISPYGTKSNCYFIEFEQYDYYLKVYDKGKQYSKLLPQTPNTLRIEIKGMNSRFLNTANINTLADLLQQQHLQVLALKFAKITKGIVFEDNTIQVKQLTKNEKKLYRELSNPRSWKQHRGNANSTFRNKVNRFKKLVDTVGSRNIYSTISTAINNKIIELSENNKLSDFLTNTYTLKTAKTRCCLSCCKDISRQHANSKFCSAKFVGEKAAKQCRNSSSNQRNNFKRKVSRINSKGVLFDIAPFFVAKKSRRSA